MVAPMFTPRGVFVAIAVWWLIVTVAFVALLAIAVIRRRRRGSVGRTTEQSIAFVLGLELGTLFLVNAGPASQITLVVIVGLIAISSWRRGRRTDAGMHLAGAALPWTFLWGTYLWALMNEWNDFDVGSTVQGFLVGLVPVAIGFFVASRGDREAPRLQPSSIRWEPGSRTFGTIGAALRSSTRVGPFGVQELATIAAIIGVQVPLGLVLANAHVPVPIQVVVLAVVAAGAATEAYIRSLYGSNRRAFEAFSWLGEREIARVRAQTGEGVPITKAKVEAWLTRHPDQADQRWIRAELLMVAGRLDEGLQTAEQMPEPTPLARVGRLSTIGMAQWLSGENPDVAGLEAAVAEVPTGTEDRLEAEVMLAATRTRIRMADGRTEPGDANQPLVDVRLLLGRRADGQVGRAFRKRLFPAFLGLCLLFGALEVAFGSIVPLGG
jgi:hypothetical protein